MQLATGTKNKGHTTGNMQRDYEPRSQGFSLLNWVGGKGPLASTGHVPILHPKILGVIN